MTDVQQMDNFHIKGLYQRLQGQFPKVEWRKLILNNQGAPKWKFIFRLAICDRLATRDRIARWGINTTPLCALCNICNETVEHLLFECEVSGSIWKKVLRWQTIPRGNMVWQREIQWVIRNYKGRSNGAAVYKVAMTATVYYVWQEKSENISIEGKISRCYTTGDHTRDLFSSKPNTKASSIREEVGLLPIIV
ncbi:uncharacterized protein [Solanum tuberosum]|uniref:uncharacterized protein n=1 Tax=Solanum tuberosum TaxID=4113 RepID=UPI00073A2147|nr:PREDICTED: uncharacterized protein LOC107062871 [Solanum tuberosum]